MRQQDGGWTTVAVTVGLGTIASFDGDVCLGYLVGLEPYPTPPWPWPLLAAVVSVVAGCHAVYLRVDGRPMARWGLLSLTLAAVVETSILLPWHRWAAAGLPTR
jgi:hypothetical protein